MNTTHLIQIIFPSSWNPMWRERNFWLSLKTCKWYPDDIIFLNFFRNMKKNMSGNYYSKVLPFRLMKVWNIFPGNSMPLVDFFYFFFWGNHFQWLSWIWKWNTQRQSSSKKIDPKHWRTLEDNKTACLLNYCNRFIVNGNIKIILVKPRWFQSNKCCFLMTSKRSSV